MIGIPLAYLITFRTYGSWLPGDENGHINRFENVYQTPYVKTSSDLHQYAKRLLKTEPFVMNEQTREIVLQTIISTSQMYSWDLHALHVRTNHVHLLITTNESVEKVLTKFKITCSEQLNYIEQKKLPRWARHGSTRYIFKEQNFYNALNYVIHEQGKKMAIYVSDVWQGILLS